MKDHVGLEVVSIKHALYELKKYLNAGLQFSSLLTIKINNKKAPLLCHASQ